MNRHIFRYPDSFAELRISVFGDALLDRYLIGCTAGVSREAPVPQLSNIQEHNVPGGAANVAMNTRAMGANVRLISVVGLDNEGHTLRRALEDGGVNTRFLLLAAGRQTILKSRLITDNQILLRFDRGEHCLADAGSETMLHSALREAWEWSDAIIISDYDYGLCTDRLLLTMAELQITTPKIVVVDSKRQLPRFASLQPTAVKPNYEEAALLISLPRTDNNRADALYKQGEELRRICNCKHAVITLDREGALLFSKDTLPYRAYTRPVNDSSAVGAGDTFISGLTLALASKATAAEAVDLASAAAQVILRKQGTSLCSKDELTASLLAISKLVVGIEEFIEQLKQYRREHKKVVFTNGCFDILHSGHISCLHRAKELGDVLIVAVNGDKSVRRLKGEGRPINRLQDRLKVLNALQCVDHIITFEQDTAAELIRQIRPDIYVKGATAPRAAFPEVKTIEQLGAQVEILPVHPRRSTGNIIRRIKRSIGTTEQKAISNRTPNWNSAERLLVIRLDTLGDVLMLSPALRALRQSFNAELTLLTSSRGRAAAELLKEPDRIIVHDVCWMKATSPREGSFSEHRLIQLLTEGRFDAAIIPTTYTQSPLPAALACYLADIPLRLAYCRENPYQLLTDWVHETEPEKHIRHEVRRHLDLVETIGASTKDEQLRIAIPEAAQIKAEQLIEAQELNERNWIVVHPGASAPSRRYPITHFKEALGSLTKQHNFRVVFTGTTSESELIEKIREDLPDKASISLAGELTVPELAALIAKAPLLLSNNTGPAHIAAATGTPVTDLYALTNLQHTPWMVPQRVLFHDVPCRSCYKSLCPKGHHHCLTLLDPQTVVSAVLELYEETQGKQILPQVMPEMTALMPFRNEAELRALR